MPYTLIAILVALIASSLRIVKEYERGVIFFLGKCTGVRFPINLVTLKLKKGQASLPFTFVSYNDAKIIQEKLREITMK